MRSRSAHSGRAQALSKFLVLYSESGAVYERAVPKPFCCAQRGSLSVPDCALARKRLRTSPYPKRREIRQSLGADPRPDPQRTDGSSGAEDDSRKTFTSIAHAARGLSNAIARSLPIAAL